MNIFLRIIALILLTSCSEEVAQTETSTEVDTVTVAIEETTVETIIATPIEQTDSLVAFLIFGEQAPVGYLDSENPITEQYGFKLKRITGCQIDPELLKNSLAQNNQSLQLMNEKYGEQWMNDFENSSNFKLAIPF